MLYIFQIINVARTNKNAVYIANAITHGSIGCLIDYSTGRRFDRNFVGNNLAPQALLKPGFDLFPEQIFTMYPRHFLPDKILCRPIPGFGIGFIDIYIGKISINYR